MYILIAILIFGFLIATHELGHFMAAKACGVRVLEYAIGMGPAIFKKQGRETLYSLRLLPLGGYCAMEGEDTESEDPRAFSNQSAPRRAIILVAGAAMNFLTGFVLILLLFSQTPGFVSPTITSFAEGCPYAGEDGLMEGDTFYKINGERIYFSSNISTYLARSTDGTADIVVIRNGEKVYLNDYSITPVAYEENGETVTKYGFNFESVETGILAHLKYAWYCALDFVRMVRIGLVDLFTGAVSINQMSGVVGIVDIINDVGTSSPSVLMALSNITYLAAFIAINLAVMNLLPIPALDGGRILFLLLTFFIEKISRRRLDPKYEGYVHAAGFVLLLSLMVFVMFNDIWKILSR
jgi:regulator of sigma E protease